MYPKPNTIYYGRPPKSATVTRNYHTEDKFLCKICGNEVRVKELASVVMTDDGTTYTCINCENHKPTKENQMRKELQEILQREYTDKIEGITDNNQTHEDAVRKTLTAVTGTLTVALEYMSSELDRLTDEDDSYLDLEGDTAENDARIKDREENPYVENQECNGCIHIERSENLRRCSEGFWAWVSYDPQEINAPIIRPQKCIDTPHPPTKGEKWQK